MFEFISTEGSYVRDCQLIVEVSLPFPTFFYRRVAYVEADLFIRSLQVFYANLMNLLDDKELVVIFANIEDILISSTTMLSELGEFERRKGWEKAFTDLDFLLNFQRIDRRLLGCTSTQSPTSWLSESSDSEELLLVSNPTETSSPLSVPFFKAHSQRRRLCSLLRTARNRHQDPSIPEGEQPNSRFSTHRQFRILSSASFPTP